MLEESAEKKWGDDSEWKEYKVCFGCFSVAN